MVALLFKCKRSFPLLLVLTVLQYIAVRVNSCDDYKVCVGPDENIYTVIDDVIKHLVNTTEPEHSLLRAIALAESQDGMCTGGVWGVNQTMLDAIKSDRDVPIRYTRLYCPDGSDCIKPKLTTEMMSDPLYSGLAALMYIHVRLNGLVIPSAGDITGQYEIWNEHFKKEASMIVSEQELRELLNQEQLNGHPYSYLIFQQNETGAGVVQDVVDLLEMIDKSMLCLLRRIALVETNDGKKGDLSGGIWAIDQEKLVTVQKWIERRKRKINDNLCIIVSNDSFNSTTMRIPFYSGLAAYLYIDFINKTRRIAIPDSEDIEAQAEFWKEYYHNGSMTVKDCVRIVEGEPPPVGVDETLIKGANGSDVVEAVLSKLDTLEEIFGPDHRFMRRLAYVETRDGTEQDEGGIWGVDAPKIQLIRETLNDPASLVYSELNEALDSIAVNKQFQDVHSYLNVDQMAVPLYSGLAARLFLYYIQISGNINIPQAGELEEQAVFWVSHYHHGEDEQNFLKNLVSLEQRTGCKVNADIYFVLDVSGSIGDHLKKVIEFEREFISNLTDIGPNHTQVGTIIFNETAQILFNLSTYTTKEEIDQALNKTMKARGSTNILDGLCQLKVGFSEERGARKSVSTILRLAVILTDGHSNRYNNPCNFSTNITQAAKEVHVDLDPLLVFVIGVTNNIKEEELIPIATFGDFTHLDSFNKNILTDTQLEQTDSVCNKVSQNLTSMDNINGNLPEDGVYRCNYPLFRSGITITVCISTGQVIMFGSLSVSNPNAAHHNFSISIKSKNETDTLECKSIYIPNPDFLCINTRSTNDPIPSRKRSVPTHQDQSPHSSGVVYLSFIGKDKVNHFVVNSSGGNNVEKSHTTPTHSPEQTSIHSPEPTPIHSPEPTPIHSPEHTPTPTHTPEQESQHKHHLPNSEPCKNCKRSQVVVVATTSTFSVLAFFIISILVAMGVYRVHTLHQEKKKKHKEVEDCKRLLDLPDSNEYAEFTEEN